MTSILFVCTANQIRSPLASAIFKKFLDEEVKLPQEWQIDSAGVWARPNLAPEPNAIAFAADLEIDLTEYRSKQINERLLKAFDMIIVMEKGQKESICYEYPEIEYKVFLFTEFGEHPYDFPDPHGMPPEKYRGVLVDLYTIIAKNYPSIIRRAENLSSNSIMY